MPSWILVRLSNCFDTHRPPFMKWPAKIGKYIERVPSVYHGLLHNMW